jgi:hypothetical protein
MKKVMAIVGMVMVACCIMAQGRVYKTNTITVPAGVTNVATSFSICDDGTTNYRYLDCVKFIHETGPGTGTITVVSMDIGIETAVYNAGAHVPSYSTVSYPRREQAMNTSAGWVVTNNVIVAKSTVDTAYDKYACRIIKINIAQPSSALANTYRYSLFAD